MTRNDLLTKNRDKFGFKIGDLVRINFVYSRRVDIMKYDNKVGLVIGFDNDGAGAGFIESGFHDTVNVLSGQCHIYCITSELEILNDI